MSKNRLACLTDLNDFFSKKDLLGGLTPIEQTKLRANIGVIDYTGEGGQSSPLQITYANLDNLIQSNILVVGARYQITDFQSIYTSNIGESWGASINPSTIYNLIVIANTNNTLDPRAFILGKPNWTVEYNATKETLSDGVTTKGKITYLKDQNGNSAYYDFKNIRSRRTQAQLSTTSFPTTAPYLDLYTFSDVNGTTVIENSDLNTTKYNTLNKDCWNNVFIGDTYNNIIEENCQGNTILKGFHDNILKWDSVNNLFNENICYLTGSIYNKTIDIGDTSLSTAITKTIHKVNDATIVSYLDPITYAYQIIVL